MRKFEPCRETEMNAYQAFNKKFKQVAGDTHSAFSRGRINWNQVNSPWDLLLFSFGKLMKYTAGYFAGLIAGLYAAVSTAISNYFQKTPPVKPEKLQQEAIVPVLTEAEIVQKRIADLKKQIIKNAFEEKKTQLSNKIKQLLTTVQEQITVLNAVCQPYDAVFNPRAELASQLSYQKNIASNAKLTEKVSVYRAKKDRKKDDVQAYVCVCCGKEQSCPKPADVWGHQNNVKKICKKSRWPRQECQLELMEDKVMVTKHVPDLESRNVAKKACTRIEAKLNSAEYQLPPKPQEYLLRELFMKTRQNLQLMSQGIVAGNNLTCILDRYIKELKETATRFSPEIFKINDYLPKSDYASCVVTMHKMKALNIGYGKSPSFFNHFSDDIKDLILSYFLSPNFPLHRRLSALPALPALEDVPVELTVELIDEALAEVNNRPSYY